MQKKYMQKKYIENDYIQENYLNTEYTFIKDFILLICIYFFYINRFN